jgi:ribulose-5-phosphate 4-epimerase/fuculose-1-phosphate aldolase
VLGAEDQGDLVWGHVSARDPDGRGAWIKASTYGFEEIGAEQVILVDRDGRVSRARDAGTPSTRSTPR